MLKRIKIICILMGIMHGGLIAAPLSKEDVTANLSMTGDMGSWNKHLSQAGDKMGNLSMGLNSMLSAKRPKWQNIVAVRLKL